jgi:hypothetical protein
MLTHRSFIKRDAGNTPLGFINTGMLMRHEREFSCGKNRKENGKGSSTKD